MRMKSVNLLLFILILTFAGFGLRPRKQPDSAVPTSVESIAETPQPAAPAGATVPASLPEKASLIGGTHVFQTFNNCGPASLSMALSLYEISETQQTLGQRLRPYQNPQGNNDDKSVTLPELAGLAPEYGLTAYHRPAGNIDILKSFVASGLPVITRTLLEEGGDIGHYRVITGYDDSKDVLIQNDSLQGRGLEFGFNHFNRLWEKFNYEYLVLVPEDKLAEAEGILGEDLHVQTAWQKARQVAQNKLGDNPDDIYARFNLSVAYYNLGDYQVSAAEFEKVEDRLPFRTLWYQTEPIKAYAELGDAERVFAISDEIFENGNRAASELYQIRGELLLARGKGQQAREEFEKALLYNANIKS